MSGDALDSLALAGDALGADQGPETGPQPTPGPPPESPNLGAIAMALTAFRELSCRMLEVESPRQTMNDENVQAVSAVLAPLADKYGINLMSIDWGVEFAALVVAGPIVWTAAQQLNHELKAKKAKPVEPEKPVEAS